MRAVKANKVYSIDESQKKFYQDAGFDIVDEDGKTIAYGRGKTVPYGDYMAVKKEKEEQDLEMEALREKIAQLEAAPEPAKSKNTKAGA